MQIARLTAHTRHGDSLQQVMLFQNAVICISLRDDQGCCIRYYSYHILIFTCISHGRPTALLFGPGIFNQWLALRSFSHVMHILVMHDIFVTMYHHLLVTVMHD